MRESDVSAMNMQKIPVCYLISIGLFLSVITACTPVEEITPTLNTAPEATLPVAVRATSTAMVVAEPEETITGEIRILYSWSADKTELLLQVLEEFKAQHPAVRISLAYYTPDTLKQGFISAVENGQPPTLIIAPSTLGQELYNAGWILDVENRLPESFRDQIYPLLWSQISYDQNVIGVPLEQKGIVLIRNRRMVPAKADTVEGLKQAAFQINDGPVVGAALDFEFINMASFLSACNGQLASAYDKPAFSGPVGECWADIMWQFACTGWNTQGTDDDLNLFLEGRSAWLIDGTWKLKELSETVGENWVTVDSWPTYAATGKRLAGFVWTENAYLVNGLSPADDEASWAFIEFLISVEIQNTIVSLLGTSQIPAYQYVALNNLLLRQVVFALERSVPLPLEIDLELYQQALEPEIMDILQGGDPGLALLRAETTILNSLQVIPAGEE